MVRYIYRSDYLHEYERNSFHSLIQLGFTMKSIPFISILGRHRLFLQFLQPLHFSEQSRIGSELQVAHIKPLEKVKAFGR
jgi:hypothetical protein